MSYCQRCGTGLSAQAVFCPSCGTAIGSAPDQTVELPTPPSTSSPGAPSPAPPRSPAVTPRWEVDDPKSPRFDVGALLGDRYRVIGRLGEGGMGEVYRADDLRLGESVALKFLPARLSEDESSLRQLRDEVRLTRQVSHASVCRVHDLVEIDGETCISMEYIDGEDLGSLLRRIGRFPEDKGVEIGRQLCAGLAAAHERGVLHRDLKPPNIMLDGRGQVKINDFGIAALVDLSGGVGGFAGTPVYMAPEIIRGEPATVRSDIYSLGLVLFEIFTGRRAIAAETMAEIGRWHEQGGHAALTPGTGLDPRIGELIERCLDADPERRPTTALAVAAALPGGDPLLAALAAGETPSPQLVAAAGG